MSTIPIRLPKVEASTERCWLRDYYWLHANTDGAVLCVWDRVHDRLLTHVCDALRCGLWYVGVFYIGGREGRCGVFRRLCVGMTLGWDFHWFGAGRGCDASLQGGRVRKGRPWGRADVFVCHDCAAGGVPALCICAEPAEICCCVTASGCVSTPVV